MPARIRKLEEDDIDGISEMWQEFATLREGQTRSRILNEDAPDYFFGYATGLLQRRDTLTLVAEVDGHIVGYLIAQKQRRPPIYHHTRVAYLSDAFVGEQHRRKGILRKFLEELYSWCRRENITAVDVQVFKGNKTAQQVYEQLGFNEYRILYRKELEPAPSSGKGDAASDKQETGAARKAT